MKSFLQYINSYINENKLDEAAINIGNSSATPRYNQVIILAGGAGSGKGHVLGNILNIPNATVFDVDALKQKAIKYAPKSMDDKFKEMSGGRSLKSLDLGNPEDTRLLHMFMETNGYSNKVISNFLYSVGDINFDGTPREKPNNEKPNIVFDVTLKNLNKLSTISNLVTKHGYKLNDIHLVWIVTEFTTAIQQNQERSRKVPDDILHITHVGANNSVYDIVHDFMKYQSYMNGEIWIVPNKRGVDNNFDVHKGYNPTSGKSVTSFILTRYKAVKIKDVGKPLTEKQAKERMGEEYINIVNNYTPSDAKKW